MQADYKVGIKVILNDEQRKAVTEILVKGFTDRKIPLKASATNEAKLNDPKLLHAYVKGLINNWLTKSKLLNGKGEQKAKAPTPAVVVTAETRHANTPLPTVTEVKSSEPPLSPVAEVKAESPSKTAGDQIPASKKPVNFPGKK